jgi:hypothetical protein
MGIVLKLIITITLFFWISIFILIDASRRTEWFLSDAWKKPLLENYKPKNGDILIVHYIGHGLNGIPIIESYPTHTAFVYLNEKGNAFALEATRFAAPEQPNNLNTTVHNLSGIRMVPLAHFINSVDSVIYIREIENGTIKSETINAFLDWASTLKFETRILDSMTFDVTIAIGFRLVWPKISKVCMHTSRLYELERRKNQVFCSEFVSRLLQNVGAINTNFTDHYLMSPASFLKSAFYHTIEPNLESIAEKGFSWKEDQMLVRAGKDLIF